MTVSAAGVPAASQEHLHLGPLSTQGSCFSVLDSGYDSDAWLRAFNFPLPQVNNVYVYEVEGLLVPARAARNLLYTPTHGLAYMGQTLRSIGQDGCHIRNA